MTYIEKRSKRAIAIDRALQARRIHKSFNQPYKQAPNRSDVQDYDTRMRVPPEPTGKPKPEPPHRNSLEEYKPSPAETVKLRKIFHKQTLLQQHHDLLVTRNVARNKADIEKWKKKPTSGDIRGIDTQPEPLIPKRLDFTTKFVGNPEVIMRKFGWKAQRGDYAGGTRVSGGRYRPDKESAGSIRVDTRHGQKIAQQTLAHELGHAFDRNIAGVKRFGERPIGVGHIKTGSRFSGVDLDEEKYNEVSKATEIHSPFSKKNASISYSFYRNKQEERFANWFSAMITNRTIVKKHSPNFYKQFKQDYPDFSKGLFESDAKITKQFMSGSLI